MHFMLLFQALNVYLKMSDKDTAIPFTDPNLSLVTELLMSRHCAAKQVSRNTMDTRRVRIRTVQSTAGSLENNVHVCNKLQICTQPSKPMQLECFRYGTEKIKSINIFIKITLFNGQDACTTSTISLSNRRLYDSTSGI